MEEGSPHPHAGPPAPGLRPPLNARALNSLFSSHLTAVKCLARKRQWVTCLKEPPGPAIPVMSEWQPHISALSNPTTVLLPLLQQPEVVMALQGEEKRNWVEISEFPPCLAVPVGGGKEISFPWNHLNSVFQKNINKHKCSHLTIKKNTPLPP